MDTGVLLAVFVVVALAGAVQGMVGFGFALAAVPLLAVALGARDTVVLVALLTVPLNAGIVWRHHRDVVRPTARRQMLAALIGMPFGVVVLLAVSPQVLLAVISVAVLATVVALVRGVELHPHGPRVDYGSGFVSGVLATSIGVNGPPLVAVYHGRGFAPAAFRATASAVFFVTGVVAAVLLVGAGAMSADGWWALVPGLLALPVGWLVGDWLHHRTDPERFRNLVLVLLVVAALTAGAEAVVG